MILPSRKVIVWASRTSTSGASPASPEVGPDECDDAVAGGNSS